MAKELGKPSEPNKSHHGATGLHLVQAWRVENPQLWEQYSAARSAVQKQVEQVQRNGVRVPTLRTELHTKTQGMPRMV